MNASTTMERAILPFMHYTPSIFLNPPNPITVSLIGAGGTGSQVMSALGRMNLAMNKLGHPGLQVVVWDDDVVSEANVGRQLFVDCEIGLSKGAALVNRTNRFFATSWKAMPFRFDKKSISRLNLNYSANIFISCVDTVSARFEIAELLKAIPIKETDSQNKPYYWMDCGNSKNSGQVILSTIGTHKQPQSAINEPVGHLPFITDEFAELLKKSESDDNTPSCSLAEALTKQGLFINTVVANYGCALLYRLFSEAMTPIRGIFLNLEEGRSSPLQVG